MIVPEPTETAHSDAAVVATPERSAVRRGVETPRVFGPTEREIGELAFQLWLDRGCPEGTALEDWFRAEAMLKAVFAAAYERLLGYAAIPGFERESEDEVMVDFRWEGHWESWEREWGGTRWISEPGRLTI
jgi:hypothetical protein